MIKEIPALVKRPKAHIDVLKSIKLFEGFSDNDLCQVLDSGYVGSYKKRKLLFLTEDKATCFYVVISGWVKLFRETRDGHESVLALMTSGDSFGKAAAFEGTNYPYSAEVTDDAVLLEISANSVKAIAKDKKIFDSMLSNLMKSRLDSMNQLGLHSEHLALMTSAQRTGCFLLRLCGDQHEGCITLTLPYEKALVAAKLGMTPETLSRSLGQLTKVGVKTQYNRVTVNNIAQLRNYTCSCCSATTEECQMACHAQASVSSASGLKSRYAFL